MLGVGGGSCSFAISEQRGSFENTFGLGWVFLFLFFGLLCPYPSRAGGKPFQQPVPNAVVPRPFGGTTGHCLPSSSSSSSSPLCLQETTPKRAPCRLSATSRSGRGSGAAGGAGAGPEEEAEEGEALGGGGGAAIPGRRIAACAEPPAAAGRMIAAQLLAYYFTELKEDQVKKVHRNPPLPGRFLHFFNFFFFFLSVLWLCPHSDPAMRERGINPFLSPARCPPPSRLPSKASPVESGAGFLCWRLPGVGDARCRSGRGNPARPSWAGVWGLWRGALAMMVVMILLGFSWAASIPGEGTSPSSPGCLRALCHSSTGGDEAKEQVVFELCVTAASEFTGSGCQLCLKRRSISMGFFSFPLVLGNCCYMVGIALGFSTATRKWVQSRG